MGDEFPNEPKFVADIRREIIGATWERSHAKSQRRSRSASETYRRSFLTGCKGIS